MLHKLLSEVLFTQDVTAAFSHGLPQCSRARCLIPICAAESWQAIRPQGFGGCMSTIYHQDMDTGTQRSSEQLVWELGGALQQHVHNRVKPVPAEHHSTPAAPPQQSSRGRGEQFLTTLPCHVSLACASDLPLITHLSLSESWQLLRKNPGCSPVPGRTVTRQSFLGLRAGVSPADWQALLTLYSLFLFTLCWYLFASLSLSSLSFSFAL